MEKPEQLINVEEVFAAVGEKSEQLVHDASLFAAVKGTIEAIRVYFFFLIHFPTFCC